MLKNYLPMKKILITLVFLFGLSTSNAQSTCQELIDYVKSESYGTTYMSYNSDAISQVTFYTVVDGYDYYYFAIVRFANSYQDYIYQVASNTKSNYSMNYLTSAGKAFWKYIQPYNDNLNCAPDFD